MRSFLDRTLIFAGLLLLVCGYVVWFAGHESDGPRAVRSFVYLIPGWALIAMGYISWRIQASEHPTPARRDDPSP
jgi:uncharacterized membrane protein